MTRPIISKSVAAEAASLVVVDLPGIVSDTNPRPKVEQPLQRLFMRGFVMTKKTDSTLQLNRRKLLRSRERQRWPAPPPSDAPAIIRRAHAADAKDAFKGEQLVVVSGPSGNDELAFREHVAEPFHAR